MHHYFLISWVTTTIVMTCEHLVLVLIRDAVALGDCIFLTLDFLCNLDLLSKHKYSNFAGQCQVNLQTCCTSDSEVLSHCSLITFVQSRSVLLTPCCCIVKFFQLFDSTAKWWQSDWLSISFCVYKNCSSNMQSHVKLKSRYPNFSNTCFEFCIFSQRQIW